ncbi:MAG: hypothetical protein HOE62_09505 [Alphaproteobacteria bacterium]|jgi:hypothetical protein|nr:hypothetical protein [Alphaproteobacteria bacterium]MBT4018173.1 hypothetical protein [Alphaproteobacteria bacterium]MBT4965100.1 hypothetical protein [Alphaproteobacteria bacterium]MBT5160230.1 hypothetical protein [Alphaproteobacteria bacterium]MBT5917025.1 hypothetical protein [Alphaproteobacteria bacterium]
MTEAPDVVDIKDDAGYRVAMATLNKQSRPPVVLRLLMSAFEAYRQSRRIGWSRPWNKYGINTFQSFRLAFPADDNLIDLARAVLDSECADIPEDADSFIQDLLSGDDLMGFVFVHEFEEGSKRFEGATLSFGRKTQRRYRDRLDLIVEAPVEGAGIGEMSRLRVFVDPYRGVKPPLWQTSVNAAKSASVKTLYEELGKLSHAWAGDTDKLWDHWTSRYIDYFGPRRWPLGNTPFYVETSATPSAFTQD